MRTAKELLEAICKKGGTLWIHCGALHYRGTDGTVAPGEISVLNGEARELILEMTLAHQFLEDPPSVNKQSVRCVPVTFQQQFALRFCGQYFLGVFAVRLRGAVDVDSLQRCFELLICRHEALRTRIAVSGMVATQQVTEIWKGRLECESIGEPCNQNVESELQRRFGAFVDKWRKAGESTFEGRLIKVADGDFVLLIVGDHLLYDFHSIKLLFQELWETYRVIAGGGQPPVVRAPTQYPEYAVSQRRKHSQWIGRHGAYWTEKLRGAVPLRVPKDREATSRECQRVLEIAIPFGETLSSDLYSLAQHERVTLASAVVALVAICMSCWSSQRDFVLPVGYTGRYSLAHVNMVGFLLNVLPLRIVLGGRETFSQLFKMVSQEFMSGIAHLDLGNDLDCQIRDLLKGGLIQYFPSSPMPGEMLTPKPEKCDGLSIEPFAVNWRPPEEIAAAFDPPVGFAFWNSAQGIIGAGGYRGDLFTPLAIQRFSETLTFAAQSAVKDPGERAEQLLSCRIKGGAPPILEGTD